MAHYDDLHWRLYGVDLDPDDFYKVEGRPSPPKPARSGRFEYSESQHGAAGLKLDGQSVTTMEDLQLMSHRGALKFRPKAWMSAQLECYGVSSKKSATKLILLRLLEDMIKSGQHVLRPQIIAIKNTLRHEFYASLHAYERNIQRWKDEQFEALGGDPTQEAALDVKRFAAKYFLTGVGGQPDRAKTKEPVVLHQKYGDAVKSLLDDLGQEIPGLRCRFYMPYRGGELAIIGWDTEMQRAKEREFARLSTSGQNAEQIASAEARFDSHLFLKKHFGIEIESGSVVSLPDDIPSTPVVLLPSSIKWFRYHLEKIPELYIRYVESGIAEEKRMRQMSDDYAEDPRYAYVVIGWDASRVDAEILRLETEKQSPREAEKAEELAAQEKIAPEKQARWDRVFEQHQKYMVRHKTRPGPLRLKDLLGTYIVKWDGKESDYSYPHNPREAMKLHIFEDEGEGGVMATIKFKFMDGTMLMAMSRHAVELFREAQPQTMEEELGKDIAEHMQKTGEKRPLHEPSATLMDSYLAKRRRTEPALTPGSGEAGEPNRVYFQFAFTEYHGQCAGDETNSQVGHLDFDALKLSAKGSMNLPGRSEPQRFSIFKVSKEPLTEHGPTSWHFFDPKRRRNTLTPKGFVVCV